MPAERGTARIHGLRPGGRATGELRVPGSKSLAQRALVCAALAQGSTRIAGLPDGADASRARELVAAVGARVVDLAPRAVEVRGLPPGPQRGWSPEAPLALGESGTLARLATGVLALCGTAGREFELSASGSLLGRSSAPLFGALRDAGVRLSGDRWPLRVTPVGPPSEITLREPVSSQEASALLIALAAYPDTIVLSVVGEVPSRPYLEMTLAVLADFDVRVTAERVAGGERFVVPGPLVAPQDPLTIEPDASSAAVALAAACLSDGELFVPGLDMASRQGDVAIVAHLTRFGTRGAIERGGLRAGGRPLHGASLDLSGEPDLAPVLAALAGAVALQATAAGDAERARSELLGLETLPGKESSRIEVLADGLTRLGLAVEAKHDRLRIAPGCGRTSGPIELDAHGDHRMAFAFALLGLVVADVSVSGADAVSKSWPSFWDDMRRIGLRVV